MPKGIPKDTSSKGKVLRRLKIVKGHVEKVISMVEKNEYCIDVIHQSLAVQAALKEVDKLVLNNHMQTCVADSIRKGEDKTVIDEVMKIFDKK